MVVAGELPDTRITTTADQPSVLVMVADTGDMDMGRDMDTAMDMAIAVGDFRGLRPLLFFKDFSSVRDVALCGLVLLRRRPSPLRVSAKNARYSVNLFPGAYAPTHGPFKYPDGTTASFVGGRAHQSG